MSTVSRGADLERRARAVLEHDGYATERAPKVLSWASGAPRTMQHDFFGCFDLIALRCDRPVLLVQITVRSEMRRRERKVEAFATQYAPDSAHVEVWGFLPGSRRSGGQRFARTRLVDGTWIALDPIATVDRLHIARVAA